MTPWRALAEEAPSVAEVFARRHAATGHLCMLGTLRSDGSPRISPMEPRVFDGHLVIIGMPGTLKFRDLGRDPRFCLHTATVDPYVQDGDVKLWGSVQNLQDRDVHERFAEALAAEGSVDLRGQRLDPFYVADLAGASSLQVVDGALSITIWKPGQGERVVRKA